MIDRRKSIRRLTHWARPMNAGLVVFLLFLQGWAALGLSTRHSPVGAGGASIAAVAPTADCDSDHRDGGQLPLHKHGHTQCCVFCGARNFAGFVPFVVTQIVAFVEPARGMALSELRGSDSNPPLVGWRSSWSSQAPPASS